jgi:hypothetical protein
MYGAEGGYPLAGAGDPLAGDVSPPRENAAGIGNPPEAADAGDPLAGAGDPLAGAAGGDVSPPRETADPGDPLLGAAGMGNPPEAADALFSPSCFLILSRRGAYESGRSQERLIGKLKDLVKIASFTFRLVVNGSRASTW